MTVNTCHIEAGIKRPLLRTFFNTFPAKKINVIGFKFHWILYLRAQTGNKLTLLQVTMYMYLEQFIIGSHASDTLVPVFINFATPAWLWPLLSFCTSFVPHWPFCLSIIFTLSERYSMMMLVKFLTSAKQKHWIWSYDESGLCNLSFARP